MKLKLAVLLCACLGLLGLSSQADAANTKKGVAGNVARAGLVHATWAYDWGSGRPSNVPSGVEYVPMSWGYYGADARSTVHWANTLKAAGAKHLLTFNEPDNSSQSNLSVAFAIQGYSYLTGSSLPIGSPACADDNDGWMRSFMQQVNQKKLRMDFLTVHSYIRDPNSFLHYVDSVHDNYGKPLWITEFAPTDWQSPTKVSVAEVEKFINIVIPGLNSRSYVQRYSWYTGTLPGTGVLGTAALFNSNGTLTSVGRLYASK